MKTHKSYFPPVIEEITETCEELFASSTWTDANIPDEFTDLYEF